MTPPVRAGPFVAESPSQTHRRWSPPAADAVQYRIPMRSWASHGWGHTVQAGWDRSSVPGSVAVSVASMAGMFRVPVSRTIMRSPANGAPGSVRDEQGNVAVFAGIANSRWSVMLPAQRVSDDAASRKARPRLTVRPADPELPRAGHLRLGRTHDPRSPGSSA